MTMPPTRKKMKFDYFRRVDVGMGLALIALASQFFYDHAEWMLAAAALYMFIFLRRRPRDEFALACWHRGCAAVFSALLIALIIAPFFGGMLEGFTDGYRGIPPKTMTGVQSPYGKQINWVLNFAPIFALYAFFAGFQAQRFLAAQEQG